MPFPSPGDLPDPGIEPGSPTLQADSLLSEPPGKTKIQHPGFPGRSVPTQETQVQPMGWEDPLEKEMATHSSILAWKIPWIVEPGGLQFMGPESWTRLK